MSKLKLLIQAGTMKESAEYASKHNLTRKEWVCLDTPYKVKGLRNSDVKVVRTGTYYANNLANEIDVEVKRQGISYAKGIEQMHFWHSEKMKEQLFNKGVKELSVCKVGEYEYEYTVSNREKPHNTSFDDMIYLGKGQCIKYMGIWFETKEKGE